MSEHNVDAAAATLARLAALEDCDGYVVLVLDAETGEADAYGPFDGLTATLHAEQLRGDLDRGDLPNVLVQVTRLHHPSGSGDTPPDEALDAIQAVQSQHGELLAEILRRLYPSTPDPAQ